MSIESKPDGKWHASKIEKGLALGSVILLGSAFLFPEAGVILPEISIAIALVDLAILETERRVARQFKNLANLMEGKSSI